MNRQDVEKILAAYVKPIFGFALKRCKSPQDAEDLSQEIAVSAFRALLARDDVADVSRFIWTIAHNALSNYYRDTARQAIGVSMDEMAELIADPKAELEESEDQAAIRKLQGEIAYLSRMQRIILIAYYFDGWKQADIARELGIPLGTVKWHLFEAKKELKRGMNTMREASQLKFNPIRFSGMAVSGSVGTKPPQDYFQDALAQNICYCVRETPKTVNEIADSLGVSPVYVESAADVLETAGFLRLEKEKYLANFLITETNTQQLVALDQVYKRAAALVAEELYQELTSSGILEDEGIVCNQKTDHNFLLCSLIPYLATCPGDHPAENHISFEDLATIRPDGSRNIFRAEILSSQETMPPELAQLATWSGPMWNEWKGRILWQIDSPWSSRCSWESNQYAQHAQRVLSLYAREEALSKDEYAYLAEHGFVAPQPHQDSPVETVWQVVVLRDKDIRDRLLALGNAVKDKHREELEKLKDAWAKILMEDVPEHLKRVRAYELQGAFGADGHFLVHCMLYLLQKGKLTLPTEAQKKSVSMLILPA